VNTAIEADAAVDARSSDTSWWWFKALDCRCFAVGAERWIAQVVGIHVVGIDVWIQLESATGALRSLTLRVTRGATLPEVLEMIERKIAAEAATPRYLFT
jgi:hypothetical protein